MAAGNRGVLLFLLAVGVMHTDAKSGCKLVTLLPDRWLLLPYVSCGGHTYGCQIWVRAGNACVR